MKNNPTNKTNYRRLHSLIFLPDNPASRRRIDDDNYAVLSYIYLECNVLVSLLVCLFPIAVRTSDGKRSVLHQPRKFDKGGAYLGCQALPEVL